MLVGLTVPTALALYLLPKVIQRLLFSNTKKVTTCIRKHWIAIGCYIVFCVIYILYFKGEFESNLMLITVIFHYTIVSLGEEFTYRRLIPQILCTRYKVWTSILISAFMFAFILHMNESLLLNLLIRFPMGVVFGYITTRTNSIITTVVLHTVYNLVVLSL